MAKSSITVRILGDAKGVKRAIGATESSLSRLGDKAKGIAGKIGAIGAAAGGGLLALGTSFDSAADTIIVGTGASGAALDDLIGSFQDVAKNVPSSMGNISTAVADLNTRLGLTGDPLEDMSTRFLNLSRITKTDLTANIKSITRAFGDAGIATEDQAAALDKIFKATQVSGVGLERLTTLTTNFGAPLRQLGFNFDDSLALFSKWEQEGVNIEAVMAGMKQGLGKLAKAGEEPADALERLVGEISAAGSTGEATAIAIETFGQRAGPDMAAAIREGRFELDDMRAAILDSDGAIEDATARTDSWQQQLRILVNRGMIRLAPIAKQVFEGVGRAIETVSPYLERMADWLEVKIPPIVASLRGWFDQHWPAIRAAIGNVVTWLVDDAWPVIAQVMGGIRDAAAAVAAWFDEHWPQIRATIDAFVVWFREDAWPVIEQIFGFFREQVAELAAWFEEYWPKIQQVVDEVITVVRAAWGAFGEDIIRITTAAFEAIGIVIDTALNVIKDTFAIVLNLLTGDWAGAWEAMKKLVSDVWAGIKALIGNTLGLIRDEMGRLLGKIAGAMADVWDGALSYVADTWASITGAIGDAIDDVIGYVAALPGRVAGAIGDGFKAIYDDARKWINKIIDGWNDMSFSLPSVNTHIPGIGTVGGWSINTPNIPRLHSGGFVGARAGAALDVPAILQQGEYVLSRSDVAAIRSGGTGTRVEIGEVHMHTDLDVDAWAAALAMRIEVGS